MNEIEKGEIACIILAGGQGSRLGFNKAKALYPIGIYSKKTLLQIHIEKIILRTKKPSISIMTSDSTHNEIQNYVEENFNFKIECFKQKMLPCLSLKNNNNLFDKDNKLILAPNGNGGIYDAIKSSGVLYRMKIRGIKFVNVICVDNSFANPLDLKFVRAAINSSADITNMVVQREINEKVGVVFGDRIIEYTDSHDLSIIDYPYGNICNHIFSIEFLQRVNYKLPYHNAIKNIKTNKGIVKGIKREMFIFDTFPYADKIENYLVEKKDYFVPLKSDAGLSRKMMSDVFKEIINCKLNGIIEITPFALTRLKKINIETLPCLICCKEENIDCDFKVEI